MRCIAVCCPTPAKAQAIAKVRAIHSRGASGGGWELLGDAVDVPSIQYNFSRLHSHDLPHKRRYVGEAQQMRSPHFLATHTLSLPETLLLAEHAFPLYTVTKAGTAALASLSKILGITL